MSPFFLIGYALITALGIAGVALVIQRTGLSPKLTLSEEEARKAAKAATPDPLAEEPPFAAAGTFLFKTGGGFVAVRPQGARVHARAIAPGEIKAVKPVKGGVKLVLKDYADPVVVLKTDDVAGVRGFLGEGNFLAP
jgi:hypothetical protein